MGDDGALVGMVPKPAHVFDQFARMVDQRIVEGNHASRAVACLGIALSPFQAAVVERLNVPRHLGEPTVQAGLICRDHKFPVDATDSLLFGDHPAREVFGTMAPLRFVSKQGATDVQDVLHHGRKVHNGGHEGSLPAPSSGCLGQETCHPLYASQPSLQKFSTPYHGVSGERPHVKQVPLVSHGSGRSGHPHFSYSRLHAV